MTAVLKRVLRLGHRVLSPLFDPLGYPRLPRGYWRFCRDYLRYRGLAGAEPLALSDIHPCVLDRDADNPVDAHYFYQEAWAFERILEGAPGRHVDVGGRASFVGMVSRAVETTFIDIRPLPVALPGLQCTSGSVLNMPCADSSLESISCLHVAEHVGLGRYGDPLDPAGTRKAAAELHRVLAPGGRLCFALPVGRPRVMFNAHRVHVARQIVDYFRGLTLKEFSGVDDAGRFLRSRDLGALDGCDYGCGFFLFEKPAAD